MSLSQMVLSGLYFTAQRLCHRFKSLEDHEGEEDAEGKIIVVTGATSGIGKVVTKEMAKRKAVVVMACRDLRKAEIVAAEIRRAVPGASLILVQLDLSDLKSVRNCASDICNKVPHINVLINNAACLNTSVALERTKDGFEANFGTNHLGHFLLTHLLLDKIKKGAPGRIVTVGSMAYENAQLNIEDLNMERDTDPGFLNARPYNNSKLCNMLFSRELGRRLIGWGVNTYTLCPGLVDTGLFNDLPWPIWLFYKHIVMRTAGSSPEQGAETVLYCALATQCSQDTSKAYRFRNLWTEASAFLQTNEGLARQLWEISERLVGMQI